MLYLLEPHAQAGSTVPESSGVRASAGAAPGAGRKKKITRRVGYARDADEEAPQEKAAVPQPRARAAAPGSLLQGAGFEPLLRLTLL